MNERPYYSYLSNNGSLLRTSYLWVKGLRKNINNIITGEITFPIVIPNLNHTILSGVKILEFINPKIKKITENANDHILNEPPFKRG